MNLIQVRVTITDQTDSVHRQLADRIVNADDRRTVEEAVDKAAERAVNDAIAYAKDLFHEPRRIARSFDADIEKL